MNKVLEKIVNDEISQSKGRLKDAACDPGGDLNLIVKQVNSAVMSAYLRQRSRGKAEIKPALMDKYLAELDEARTVVTDTLGQYFFNCRRRWDIARIEFPALEAIVSRELPLRGIPYRFSTRRDENVLTVHIVAEYFFDIPLTMENVEKVTRLLPYFINRPDCAREEVPEIRQRRDYRLSKTWPVK